jgi:hypothetical protein
MKVLQIIWLCFITITASTQNLTGVWEGPQHSGGTLKLVLIHQGDSLFGYYTEHSMGWCSANFLGQFNTTKKTLTGHGESFIRKAFGHGLARMVLQYDSVYGREELKGRIRLKSTGANIANFGMAARVTLHRISFVPDTTSFMLTYMESTGTTRATPAFANTVETAINPPFPDRLTRRSDTLYTNRPAITLRTIVSGTGRFNCSLYDNGVYDGDTVTILHNGRVVLQNAEVSTKPLRFTINVNEEEPVHELVFWANNVGSIPPNTGLLIIEGEGRRFEVSLRSDLQSNGKIMIRLRE